MFKPSGNIGDPVKLNWNGCKFEVVVVSNDQSASVSATADDIIEFWRKVPMEKLAAAAAASKSSADSSAGGV